MHHVDDLLDQIAASLKTNFYYLSLFGALAIPDMAGALDAPDGVANKKRYAAWFEKNMGARYPDITGLDCYYFRCSMLHQGRQHIEPTDKKAAKSFDRVLFMEPGASPVAIHNGVLNGAWIIDLPRFCFDMVEVGHAWLANVRGTQPYESNVVKFVRRYPTGMPGYLLGASVIG